MKKTSVMLGMLLAAALSQGLVVSAETKTIVATLGVARDSGAPAKLDGKGNSSAGVEKGFHVGVSGPLNVYHVISRGLLFFVLPEINPAKIKSVKLRVMQGGRKGPSGNIQLYHLPKLNDAKVKKGDFEAKPAKLVAKAFMTDATKYRKWVETDVKAEILTDYKNDPAGKKCAAFRLQISDETLAPQAVTYLGRKDKMAPQLIIEYTP